MSGFKKFLLRGNLVELAVAVVIGTAFSGLINAVVSDLINPLIAAASGGRAPDFSSYVFTVNGAEFKYGHFINTVIAFLLMASIVYWLVVTPMTRLVSLFERNKAAETRECPECLSEIPLNARRCANCTIELTPLNEKPLV